MDGFAIRQAQVADEDPMQEQNAKAGPPRDSIIRVVRIGKSERKVKRNDENQTGLARARDRSRSAIGAQRLEAGANGDPIGFIVRAPVRLRLDGLDYELKQ